jgi:hypothetical protein
VGGFDNDALPDRVFGKAILAVEFERARLYYHGAGLFSRALRVRDDAMRYVPAGESQREIQAGGTGAGDQDTRLWHHS